MGLFDFFKKKPETPTVKVEVLYPNTWENGEAPAEPTSLAAELPVKRLRLCCQRTRRLRQLWRNR